MRNLSRTPLSLVSVSIKLDWRLTKATRLFPGSKAVVLLNCCTEGRALARCSHVELSHVRSAATRFVLSDQLHPPNQGRTEQVNFRER
jgi:hypothetical protein